MKPSGALRRQTPLRQQSPLKRTPFNRSKKKTNNDFSPEIRALVERRSGGRCEAATAQCTKKATHHHHRKLRRFGDHSAENDLHVCSACHLWIHTHVERAYELGFLIRGNGAG